MFNMKNFGTATGRIVEKPIRTDREDGSIHYQFTLACANNYLTKNKYGEMIQENQYVHLEMIIPAKASETYKNYIIYAIMLKGLMIQVMYTVRNNKLYCDPFRVNRVDTSSANTTTYTYLDKDLQNYETIETILPKLKGETK